MMSDEPEGNQKKEALKPQDGELAEQLLIDDHFDESLLDELRDDDGSKRGGDQGDLTDGPPKGDASRRGEEGGIKVSPSGDPETPTWEGSGEEEEEEVKRQARFSKGRLVFLLCLFMVGVIAGWKMGHVYRTRTQKPIPPPQVSAGPSWVDHQISGLFLPLEGGQRCLFLSLKILAKRKSPLDNRSIQSLTLNQVIFDAVQHLRAEDLEGYRGMKVLKGRIIRGLGRAQPDLRVEDIHFTDYLML